MTHTVQICELEETKRRQELSSATMTSRISEMTAIQQAAERDTEQMRQRNDRLNDQLTDLQRQVLPPPHQASTARLRVPETDTGVLFVLVSFFSRPYFFSRRL